MTKIHPTTTEKELKSAGGKGMATVTSIPPYLYHEKKKVGPPVNDLEIFHLFSAFIF